jgi:hypothetical protein
MRPLLFHRCLGLLTISLLACTGCVPSIAWLPDSSGFIYTSGDCQVLHYDIAQRSKRVVVADTATKTIWPAVSPDGKRIAVARHLANRDTPDVVEVVVYDLQGKVLQRSQAFPWNPPSAEGNGNLKETYLLWSPRTEHVLVMAGDHTGIYDVRNDGMIVLDRTMPFLVDPSPFRPDGAGFLCCKRTVNDDVTYAYVDWEARERPIALPPLVSDDELEWTRFPLLYDARWEDSIAVVRNGSSCLRLDAVRHRGSLREESNPHAPVDGAVRQQVVFDNRAVLRILNMEGPNRPANRSNLRIEYLAQPNSKPRAIAERAECCLVFPAPNRKVAALRCNLSGKGDRILIVNERGELIAELIPGP